LAAGLEQVLDSKRYNEIIITRATVPVGEDIGFLPGTEEEKMQPWMGAFDDNLEVLQRNEDGAGEWGRAATQELIRSRIKVKSMNFMRGRTFVSKFVIIDAVMYVDNHETGEKKVYNHFGPNKTTSSLRWGGSIYEIEEIKKDTTSYSFWPPINTTGYGKFVLNDDTSRHYAVYYVGTSKCIVEDPVRGQSLMGGSARPFSGQTISYKDSTIAMQIQEVEGSINGYNCRYWTQLTLKKVKSW
jgi:hypothetical protein